MIEAEVTCECAAIQLADLQLSLTQGMTVYIDAVRARQSKDLQRAWRASGVTLKYVTRFREQRPATFIPQSPASPSAQQAPQAVSLPAAVDEEAIAQRVAAILAPQLQAILEAVQARPAGTVSYQSLPSRGMGTVAEDVPVFIPSKIGRDDLVPIEVQATEGTDGGDVTDALAALKAARKKEVQRG